MEIPGGNDRDPDPPDDGDFARRIQSQGLTMDQYMQFTGTSIDILTEQMKPQA